MQLMSSSFKFTIYMYENSPKKCRELEVVVEELRASLEPSELPSSGGTRPLRACGTWFIAHKVAALGRLIDRFGCLPCSPHCNDCGQLCQGH